MATTAIRCVVSTRIRSFCSKVLEDIPSCFAARKTADVAQSSTERQHPVLPHEAYPVVENSRMKALVKAEAAPGLVFRDDVGIPSIGSTDVLIKIKKTSICGTDLHIYVWDEWSKRTVPVPLTIGW